MKLKSLPAGRQVDGVDRVWDTDVSQGVIVPYLYSALLLPLFLLFGSSLLPRAPRTQRGESEEGSSKSEDNLRSHIGSIEVDPRRQRGQIERKCQTSSIFDCSSLRLPQTVTFEQAFSRKNNQTSHRFEEPVTSRSEHCHIFKKTTA